MSADRSGNGASARGGGGASTALPTPQSPSSPRSPSAAEADIDPITPPPAALPPFLTVAAVLCDGQGRVLLVRKRGTAIFMQPGGKREAGETSLQTLARELHEELGVDLRPDSAQRLGEFEAEAANEPGRRVRAEVFRVQVHGEPRAGAEIEELRWLPPMPPYAVPVAPLSADHVLPAHRAQPGLLR